MTAAHGRPPSALSDNRRLDVPDGLRDYLAARQKQREERVVQMWRGLTDREQMLVKEAAVMGWVRGKMHHDQAVPMNPVIVEDVLSTADSFPDLYPHLSALGKGRAVRDV